MPIITENVVPMETEISAPVKLGSGSRSTCSTAETDRVTATRMTATTIRWLMKSSGITMNIA
jgi:hypothetical protein